MGFEEGKQNDGCKLRVEEVGLFGLQTPTLLWRDVQKL